MPRSNERQEVSRIPYRNGTPFVAIAQGLAIGSRPNLTLPAELSADTIYNLLNQWISLPRKYTASVRSQSNVYHPYRLINIGDSLRDREKCSIAFFSSRGQ